MAQEELGSLDVLVCGRCLSVFHFMEEFKLHKQKICVKHNLNFREDNDSKPKIWAFLLWKSSQVINHNNNIRKDNLSSSSTPLPNSWALYQTWVKMEENLRETWITAARTIQAFSKVSKNALNRTPVRITKTIVNTLNPAEARSKFHQIISSVL